MRLLVLIVLLGACVPTAARKSAEVEPGFDVEINGGAQLVLEGEDQDGQATETKLLPHAELDFQWGFQLGDESAIALQIKIPYTIVYSTIDVFYQLPTPDRDLYYGVGVELSAAPAVYGVVTQYLNNSLYMSLTPRALLFAGDRVGFNPQLSLGNNDGADVSIFMSYMHVFGAGFDFDVELTVCEPNRIDERHDFLILGAAARF